MKNGKLASAVMAAILAAVMCPACASGTSSENSTSDGMSAQAASSSASAPSGSMGRPPSDDAPSDERGGTPPEKPNGDPSHGGTPPGGNGGQKAEGQLGSWSMGGTDASSVDGDDYAYDAALFVAADGIDDGRSAADRISSGSYDANTARNIAISDSSSGHNGILVYNADYEISGAAIDLLTEADGSDTCDFSGKGTAIAAFGSEANVMVSDSEIHTSGVATMPIFADDGATVTVRSSVLQSDGGTLHSAYLNTPSQTLMVAPPWILGIMGTSRCSNMMGTGTTTNVIDSETSAGAWAVLSTDAGSDMYLNVYNTGLTLNNADESQHLLQEAGGQISETIDNPYTVNYGSGYGTYAIGNAVETFAGATIDVGTYATIFTGGSAIYTNLEKGKTYELRNSAGQTTETYVADKDQVTEIHSDTFGFMAHQGSNSITIENGTVVDSAYATFLVKTGHSNEALTASVDDATISNGGVLIQLMDNDDATNGGMMDADDPLNTNGGSQNFKPYHTESEGFDTSAASAGSSIQDFAFTNGEYSGNIYNASGSDGLDGSTLRVAFGKGASYSGAIASTAAVHTTYDGSLAIKRNGGLAFDDADAATAFAESYQNTYFSIDEYWNLGHVANLVNDNGANAIEVTLSDSAVWNVTGTSLLSSLTISDSAKVVIPKGVTLTVNGEDYTNCVLGSGSY